MAQTLSPPSSDKTITTFGQSGAVKSDARHAHSSFIAATPSNDCNPESKPEKAKKTEPKPPQEQQQKPSLDSGCLPSKMKAATQAQIQGGAPQHSRLERLPALPPPPFPPRARPAWRHLCGMGVGLSVVAVYSKLTRAQAGRWADPVEVWGEGYRVNRQGSCIIGGEYGMSLTNANRPADAVPVLWEAHKRELENPLWYTRSIRSERDKHLASIAMASAADSARFEFSLANQKRERKIGHAEEEGADGEVSDDERSEVKVAAEAAATTAAAQAELAFLFWDPQLAQWERMAEVFKTRFKLVTALANSGECGRARPLIEEALALLSPQHLRAIDNRRAEASRASVASPLSAASALSSSSSSGLVNTVTTPVSVYSVAAQDTTAATTTTTTTTAAAVRTHRRWADGPEAYDKVKGALLANKAYLLVGKSRCGRNLAEMASAAALAVETSPAMAYARNHAEAVAGVVTQLDTQVQGMRVPPELVAVEMTQDPNGGQVWQHTYSLIKKGAVAAAATKNMNANESPRHSVSYIAAISPDGDLSGNIDEADWL